MTRFRILLMSALSLGCVAWYRPVFPVRVTGPSMSPTYPDGRVVLASAVTAPLQRGDVVILKHGADTLIKRIAFLGGDSFVQLRDEHGGWFTPEIAGSVTALVKHHAQMRRFTVPPGSIYVVGDNFENSTDSNTFGPVPESSVFGFVQNQLRPLSGATFIGAKYLGPAGWAEAFFTQGDKP